MCSSASGTCFLSSGHIASNGSSPRSGRLMWMILFHRLVTSVGTSAASNPFFTTRPMAARSGTLPSHCLRW
jgi:hypothetical protein